jgi:hypothetical protein
LPLLQQNKIGKKRKKDKGSVFSLQEFLFGVKGGYHPVFFLFGEISQAGEKKKTLANPAKGFSGIYLKKIAIS